MSPLLEARGACFVRGSFRLGPLSLRVEPGERIALVGPNGAGKSTLLQMLGGLCPAAVGNVLLKETEISSITSQERARHLAWVPQEMDAPPEISVEMVVRLGLFPRAKIWGWKAPTAAAEAVEEVLERLCLEGLRRRPVGLLSGGERRRVLLARALVQGAALLLMDEPTAHLDPRHQRELADILDRLREERKVAVVMALHDLPFALETCERLWLLSAGRLLADGPPADALTPRRLAEAYGLPARWAPAAGGWPARVQFVTSTEEEHP